MTERDDAHEAVQSRGRRTPFVIGVTGNIASGKSTVLRVLDELGAATIDADAVYHGLIAPGLPLWHSLHRRFGDRIVARTGEIDRRALGKIVFDDPSALAELDALTHPAVAEAIPRRIAESDAPVVAVDAVKLVESGFDRECDTVWLVVADPDQQVERLMGRNRLSRAEAMRRVAAQPPVEGKLARADVVVDNRGTIAGTTDQVEAAWRRLGLDRLVRRTEGLQRADPAASGIDSEEQSG